MEERAYIYDTSSASAASHGPTLQSRSAFNEEVAIDIFDEPTETAKTESTVRGTFNRWAQRGVTGSRWIQSVDNNANKVMGQAEAGVAYLSSQSFLPSEAADVVRSAHEKVVEAQKAVEEVRQLDSLRYAVEATKILSLYTAYSELEKGLKDLQLGARAYRIANHARLLRAGMRLGEEAGETVQAMHSVARGIQNIARVEVFGDYGTYVRAVADVGSGLSRALHRRDEARILSACDTGSPKADLQWLASQLELSEEEREAIQRVIAGTSDLESGERIDYEPMCDLVKKDKEADLEAIIGKRAVAIIKDLVGKDQRGEPRISDEAVMQLVKEAIADHQYTKRKELLATGASLASFGLALALPGIGVAATGSFALRTISFGASASVWVDGLREPALPSLEAEWNGTFL